MREITRPLRLVRVAGLAGMLAVALSLAGLVLRAGLHEGAYALLSGLSTLLLAVWFMGVRGVQRLSLGRLGHAGAWAAFAGCMVIGSLNLLGAVVAVVETGFWERFLGSSAATIIPGLAVMLILWGVLALGTVSLKSGVLPRGAVLLWMTGLAITLVTSLDAVGLVTAAGVAWSSVSLLRARPPTDTGATSGGLPSSQAAGRLLPLDALRGTVMGLMAIDHASLFVRRWHPFETWNQPLPAYPTLGAMLTRLATHPCAPGFFFLMGAGMLLFLRARGADGWSQRRIAGHLALRGSLFIALEQLIVDVATSGQVNPLDFSILSGLGAVMLLGIPFLGLAGRAQAIGGAGILLAMQLIPGWLLNADLGILAPIRLLLLPGPVGAAFVLYPPIPWLGVALLGMAFARALQAQPERAYRLAVFGGLASLALFPILRTLGGFGNLRLPAGHTLIDFFNVVKYPPSLTFLLLSLGFDLVLLGLFSRAGRWLTTWCRPVVILGRAALYFFLLHWVVYAFLGWVFSSRGDLPATYLAWAVGLVALYPICQAYESFKHSMPPASAWRMI